MIQVSAILILTCIKMIKFLTQKIIKKKYTNKNQFIIKYEYGNYWIKSPAPYNTDFCLYTGLLGTVPYYW